MSNMPLDALVQAKVYARRQMYDLERRKDFLTEAQKSELREWRKCYRKAVQLVKDGTQTLPLFPTDE
jgi:hypothetical protein